MKTSLVLHSTIFNVHNTEWLRHSHTTDAAGLFCQEFAMAQDLTQIPTCIPDCDDHQPYLLDLFLCSNPASHPPLGTSVHMVVCVDVKFVVKSTNEHPCHCTVYSFSKVDWDGLRDVPWLDIFKHDAAYAAEAITQWVEIGIDSYIPKQKVSVKAPLLTMVHTFLCCCHCTSEPLFSSGHRNARNCFVILIIMVRKYSKMRGPIMLKQLVALLHLSLSDLVTTF